MSTGSAVDVADAPGDRLDPLARAWWNAALAWSPAAALAVFLLAAVRAGLPVQHLGQALLAIAITQLVPGLLVWRVVRPVHGSWLEDIVMGFAIGACLAILAQSAAGLLQQTWLSWAPSLAIASAILLVRPIRARAVAARVGPLPAAWSAAVAAVSLLLLIPTQRFYRVIPLAWTEGFRSASTDVPFHLALTAQLAHRGPTDFPFVAGEPLSYHWFSHAWVAQISATGDVPLDAVLLRLGPPLTAVLLVLAIAIAAVRLSNRLWAGPLAALIAVGSGHLNVLKAVVPGFQSVPGLRGVPVIPGVLIQPGALSLAFSSMMMMALLTVLVLRWRSEARVGSALVAVLLAFAAAGSKGSALAVVVAGVALAALCSWLMRSPARRSITIDLVLMAGSFVAAAALVFRGDANRLRLAPTEALAETGVSLLILRDIENPGIWITILAGALVLISALARGAGLLNAATVHRLRRDPVVALLAGIGLAGAAAVVLLTTHGKSQYYFLRNAMPALGVGSAIGLIGLWESLGSLRERVLGLAIHVSLAVLLVQAYLFREIAEDQSGLARVALVRTLVLGALVAAGGLIAARDARRRDGSAWRAFIAVASVTLVVSSVVPTLLDHLRDPLPRYSAPVDETERFAFSRDQIDAARWLRDHSHPRDMVMTNRHCASPVSVDCDGRRFHVAAYTERQILVEGWAYTGSWAKSEDVPRGKAYKPFWDPQTLALNDGFIESPEGESAAALYERGVRWLFIDKTVAYSERLTEYANPQFETEWALVLELERPAP